MANHHQPVLLAEAINGLHLKTGNWYIDATFGRGGHTRVMLEQGAKVVALDHDAEAIEFGQQKFASEIEQGKLILKRESFNQIGQVVKQELKNEPVNGILFDLGTSVDQLKFSNRGFSFETDSELDMRMDDRLGVKAKDILNLVDERQLAELFHNYGGEEQAKAVAKRVAEMRKKKLFETTNDLVKVIDQVKGGKRGHLNPATKVFQALRIAVNSEFDQLQQALSQIPDLIAKDGRIVIISFHEGEDRIIKQQFLTWEVMKKGERETKKPMTPGEAELEQNPRARSAKLRIFKFF